MSDTTYPIELVVNERTIKNGEIILRYTDAFGITRSTFTKFNYHTFRFGDDSRPPESAPTGGCGLLDIMK